MSWTYPERLDATRHERDLQGLKCSLIPTGRLPDRRGRESRLADQTQAPASERPVSRGRARRGGGFGGGAVRRGAPAVRAGTRGRHRLRGDSAWSGWR
jgi:hypothetical protein